jgi:hypothetical protein
MQRALATAAAPPLVARFEAAADRCRALAGHSWLVAGAVWLVVTALLLPVRGADPDLFSRVGMGRLVAVTGGVPLVDPFAYTLRHPVWIDHEWLSGVVFYGLAEWGGDWALFVFKLAALLVTIVLAAGAARLWSPGDRLAAVWLLLGFVGCRWVWASTVRAQVFTYLFLALFLYVFVDFERRGRRVSLALLPPAMALWANVHGGFVVGLGLLGLLLVSTLWQAPRGERLARAWPVAASLAGCVAATLVNPYGPAYWGYVLHAVTMPRPHITEWAPLDVLGGEGVVPNLLLGLVVAGWWLGPARRQPTALLCLVASAFFGYRHVRLSAIFVLVAVVYGGGLMSVAVERVLVGRRRETTARAAAFLLAGVLPVCAAVVAWSLAVPRAFSLDYHAYPVAALEWLRESAPGGRVLVDFNLGSYAGWRLHPRFLVSLDGRYEEVYPEETARTVTDAFDPASPTQQASFRAVSPDYVVLGARSPAFAGRAQFGPDWHVAYRDAHFAVLSRTPPPSGRPAGPPAHVRPPWEPLF